MYLSSGKSIHVGDVAGGALFNIGNWGTGGTADGDRLTVNFFSGMLVAGVRNPDYVAFPRDSSTPAYKSGAIFLNKDENLYFGAIQNNSDVDSTLLLLQVATPEPDATPGPNAEYADRLRLNPYGKMTLTADASVVGNVFDIKVGNTSVFSVDKTGTVTAAGGAIGGGGAGGVATSFVGLLTSDADHPSGFDGNIDSPGGSTEGSYADANNACFKGTGNLAGSHLCTADEIMRIINSEASEPPSQISAFSGLTMPVTAWVSNGPPGFTTPAVNDCGGWSSNASTSYGPVWQFRARGGTGLAASCDTKYALACCR